MELRHLRYFVAIAEERSFTRAAERLWVAQPGLSTQMRRLEAELGVKLFERHTRGADLTRAGELFLERARAALTAADVAGATGRDLEAGLIGSLRLGIASEARWGRASDVLQRFSRERPSVELTVLEAYGGTLWRDLRDGRLDALVAPSGHASPDLRSLELGSEPWVVLIGTGHPLAGIGPVAVEDLDGEAIAVTGHRDGASLDRAVADLFEELQVAPKLVRRRARTGVAAAVAGNEILVAHDCTRRPTRRSGRPKRLIPVACLRSSSWCVTKSPSPALAGFIELAAVRAAPGGDTARWPRSPEAVTEVGVDPRFERAVLAELALSERRGRRHDPIARRASSCTQAAPRPRRPARTSAAGRVGGSERVSPGCVAAPRT